MSRHWFTVEPHLKVIVGWDPPLQTFFGQVHDLQPQDPDDNPVLWVGAGPPQLISVAELEEALKDYCTISPELRATLEADEAADR
jgi:hypothetical protein